MADFRRRACHAELAFQMKQTSAGTAPQPQMKGIGLKRAPQMK
eukprot:CAMPEP_0177575230 /NCGR_PEP_ID=MMETSP0369-20130122/79503_1 /TAXON_ID=447022 ORGANISM="Scrippsiella hangoei-like, Strain SHHI-4" /NCGR_SAMPLE_ID=MMETSP0369 /ASSEMBLY_ACC=CAM_ASM_000364 /LENGTH=42 /DNA_ID= /DNA_START= /DNA_END= /DNA_ORIENTATION=